MSGKQCTKTGLWILDDFRSGRRVATTNRGVLDPPERLSGDHPAGWSRYDTPGSTVYISDNDEIAFAEVLSGYALKLGAKHPIQKDADFMGMTWTITSRASKMTGATRSRWAACRDTGATGATSISSPWATQAGGSTSNTLTPLQP